MASRRAMRRWGQALGVLVVLVVGGESWLFGFPPRFRPPTVGEARQWMAQDMALGDRLAEDLGLPALEWNVERGLYLCSFHVNRKYRPGFGDSTAGGSTRPGNHPRK